MIKGPEDEIADGGRNGLTCLRCRRARIAKGQARYREHQPQELYVKHLQRTTARHRAKADALDAARLEELRGTS